MHASAGDDPARQPLSEPEWMWLPGLGRSGCVSGTCHRRTRPRAAFQRTDAEGSETQGWHGGESFVPSRRTRLMCDDSRYPSASRQLGFSLRSGILNLPWSREMRSPGFQPYVCAECEWSCFRATWIGVASNHSSQTIWGKWWLLSFIHLCMWTSHSWLNLIGITLFLAASVLSRGAEPTELRYIQNVLETPPRVRGPVLGGCYQLPAHGWLQLAAPRAETHQLHGLLRKHTQAAVQARAVSRLSRLLGLKLQRHLNKKDLVFGPHKRAQDFYFHQLWLFKCVWCKVNVRACFGGELMADGDKERVPKKEIKECFPIFFFQFYFVF